MSEQHHDDAEAMVDEIIGRYGDFADPETAALVNWLDVQEKRHVVITFGGGVNEVMRELERRERQETRRPGPGLGGRGHESPT